MSSVPHKDRNFFPVRSIWVHLHVPRWVPLVQQELPTLPEHLSLPPVLSRVRVTRSLDLSVGFVDRCLSFCTFSYHCVVCSSSIYGFRLFLWYLQTLLSHESSCWKRNHYIQYGPIYLSYISHFSTWVNFVIDLSSINKILYKTCI